MFLSDLCLCAKAFTCFIRGRGEPRVFVSSRRARVSVTATCRLVRPVFVRLRVFVA